MGCLEARGTQQVVLALGSYKGLQGILTRLTVSQPSIRGSYAAHSVLRVPNGSFLGASYVGSCYFGSMGGAPDLPNDFCGGRHICVYIYIHVYMCYDAVMSGRWGGKATIAVLNGVSWRAQELLGTFNSQQRLLSPKTREHFPFSDSFLDARVSLQAARNTKPAPTGMIS